MNQADPVFAAGGALAGGTAFNPFGDALRGGTIPTNVADVNFAVVHPKDVDTSELATLDLNIYTTELFKLPAGGVGFAFGGQFRREQLTQDVDQINIDADVPGNSPAATTNAGRKDYAFYAEADIPIFSPTFSVPGFYALNLTAAVRYEAFENNDTNVAVPKFGIRWQPFDETLTVRATIGEGFREPSLIELFASPVSGLGRCDRHIADLAWRAVPRRWVIPARFEPEDAGCCYQQPGPARQRIHVPLARVLSTRRSMFRDLLYRLTSGISRKLVWCSSPSRAMSSSVSSRASRAPVQA